MNKLSPAVLRIGIALVFIWFGTQQIIGTSNWVDLIPSWVVSITTLSAFKVVYLNGIFEIIVGSALLLGYFTRISSLLLALHMFDITFIVGFNATGVRDFGLSMATLAIFLYGVDYYSLDYFRKDNLEKIEYKESVTVVNTK